MNNGREFLDYIAKNERRLKKNLRKNITYDDAIFDDVFQNTVIKVYESIVRNDKMVDNFEQYFFISSKFEYILHDNRSKKKKNITDNIDDINWLYDEEYRDDSEQINELYDEIKSYLRENYGETNSKIILSYFSKKSNGKCSYKEIAEKFNFPCKVIIALINTVRNDVELNDRYLKKYKQIKEE